MHSQRVGGTLVKIPKFTRLQVRFPRIGETWGKPIMYGLLMFTVSAYVLLKNKYSSKYHKITKLNDFGTSHFQQTCNSSTIEWSGPFWGAVFQKNKNCARWLCRYNLHLSWLLELAAAPVGLSLMCMAQPLGPTWHRGFLAHPTSWRKQVPASSCIPWKTSMCLVATSISTTCKGCQGYLVHKGHSSSTVISS